MHADAIFTHLVSFLKECELSSCMGLEGRVRVLVRVVCLSKLPECLLDVIIRGISRHIQNGIEITIIIAAAACFHAQRPIGALSVSVAPFAVTILGASPASQGDPADYRRCEPLQTLCTLQSDSGIQPSTCSMHLIPVTLFCMDRLNGNTCQASTALISVEESAALRSASLLHLLSCQGCHYAP